MTKLAEATKSNEIVALVGKGLGAWVYTGNFAAPKLRVSGIVQCDKDLFVEYSHVPKYDTTEPSDTICYPELPAELRPSRYMRIGYLGDTQIIAKIFGR